MASLRGIVGDTGIIEEVKFGTASINDLELSEDILLNSSCLNGGDICSCNNSIRLCSFKTNNYSI